LADMNITPARAGLTPKSWSKKFFSEYVRANPFAMYMGEDTSDMIQVREDLMAKEGDTVVFPAVRRLVGAGVTGNQILEGNEELLNARSMELKITYFRHAVAVSKWDEQKSIVDLLQAAKPALSTWALEKMRADIIQALGNITANGNVSVPYAAATASQRNAWLVNNSDRILVGGSKSNTSSGVMSTALATITASNKVTGATLSLAKRLAKTANPRLRPITVKNRGTGTAEEWFVVFLNSLQFRDFRNDQPVLAAQTNAMDRGKDNPIFVGGDLLWDQMIVREVPELGVITGAGAGGIDVAAGYMCGAQALGVAWAQRSTPIQNVRDYGAMKGVGVEEMRGIDKLRFGRDPTNDTDTPIDQGVFTLFNASVADA